MKRVRIGILFALVLCLTVVEPAGATTVSDIKKQQQAAQAELDKANDKLSGLEGEQDALEEQIGEMDSSLVEIMTSISILEDDINIKKGQIAQAQVEYDKAKASAESQYEAMKQRIKFMYEKGDKAYLELFLKAKSITDMLNKADYVEKVYEYDRKQLVSYQETQQEVADLKDSLETEESELEATQFEYKEEQEALQVEIDKKKQESSDYQALINQAQQEASSYKAAIKQQNILIQKIEAEQAKKAAEEAKKKAAQNQGNPPKDEKGNKEGGDGSYGTVITSATGSALGKEIANYGCQFIGNPYVPGGTSLTNGADCSGYTYAVYKAYGYSLPRNSAAQRSVGTAVDFSQAQPGDLICYAGHVGIYIGGNKIVHASTQKTGIKITTATYRPILSVRRVVS